MKTFIFLSVLFYGFQMQASEVTPYDQLFQDCIDYGHHTVSEDEIVACKKTVKAALLTTFAAQDQYLSCIDYGHSPVSEERDVECLREIRN